MNKEQKYLEILKDVKSAINTITKWSMEDFKDRVIKDVKELLKDVE